MLVIISQACEPHAPPGFPQSGSNRVAPQSNTLIETDFQLIIQDSAQIAALYLKSRQVFTWPLRAELSVNLDIPLPKESSRSGPSPRRAIPIWFICLLSQATASATGFSPDWVVSGNRLRIHNMFPFFNPVVSNSINTSYKIWSFPVKLVIRCSFTISNYFKNDRSKKIDCF